MRSRHDSTFCFCMTRYSSICLSAHWIKLILALRNNDRLCFLFCWLGIWNVEKNVEMFNARGLNNCNCCWLNLSTLYAVQFYVYLIFDVLWWFDVAALPVLCTVCSGHVSQRQQLKTRKEKTKNGPNLFLNCFRILEFTNSCNMLFFELK